MAARVTKAMRALFLAQLADSGNVAASAKAAGFGSTTVYTLRRKDDAFRAGFDAALDECCAKIEAQAVDWALNGVPKTVTANGRSTSRREHSPGFALQLLTRRAKTAVPAGPPPADVAAAVARLRESLEEMAARLVPPPCPTCGGAA